MHITRNEYRIEFVMYVRACMRACMHVCVCAQETFRIIHQWVPIQCILLNHLFNAIRWIMQCKSRNSDVFTRTNTQYKNGMAGFCMHKVQWIACLDTQAPEHHLLRITCPHIAFDKEKKNIEIAAAAALADDAVT